MSDEEYGPALPPGFLQRKKDDAYSGNSAKNGAQSGFNSNLSNKSAQSDHSCIGPVLPPGFKKSSESSDDSVECDIIGPVLPPHLQSSSSASSSSSLSYSSKSSVIGPSLPPGFGKSAEDSSGSSDDEETIGPLPSEMYKGGSSGYTAHQFEERAKKMKNKLEGKDYKEEKIQRESWMTELPSTKLGQSIGLSARTFRANAGPDLTDQSVWTDTPEDRLRKQQEEAEGGTRKGQKRRHEEHHTSKRDQQLRKEIDAYNKSKRSESLMEMHEKKLKKEDQNKDKDKPTERRPFDRELDLQVNRFDEAQKRSIIKKSQNLNKRFGHGSTEFL